MNKFFGHAAFYPGLYTDEEALQIKTTLGSKLWSLVYDISTQLNLYIGSATVNGVVFVEASGFPVCGLGGGIGEFQLRSCFHDLKQRGGDRQTLRSKNAGYILRNVLSHREPMVRSARDRTTGFIIAAVKSYVDWLNIDTSNAAFINNKTLAPDVLYSGLKVLFDPYGYTLSEIDPSHKVQLEAHYTDLVQRFNNKKSYAERRNDMYTGDKWCVMYYAYNPDMKMYPVRVGKLSSLAQFSESDLSTVQTAKPFALYRSLDAFCDANPDDAGSFRTALMFTKVHREKTADPAYDPDGFIPRALRTAYDEVGTIVYAPSSTATNIYPQIVLMGA